LSQQKILFLLILLVINVNYINYFKEDKEELFKRMNLLNNKIEKEKKLDSMDINISELNLTEFNYFFDKNITYSKSMGILQEVLTKNAKGLCEINYIKWSQVPLSHQWYQKLKFNFSVLCKPKELLLFINKLQKYKKLILLKDIMIRRKLQDKKLQLNTTVIGFRLSNEKN